MFSSSTGLPFQFTLTCSARGIQFVLFLCYFFLSTQLCVTYRGTAACRVSLEQGSVRYRACQLVNAEPIMYFINARNK